MYQHHTEQFGRFERHIFSNPLIKNSFSIVPEQGAVLLDTFFDGINVIDGFKTPKALELLKWGNSIMLYPFPNRMKDGEYEHNGKIYTFPIDNAATNNAIHGFGKKMSHEIVAMTVSENFASVTCRNLYDGHLPYYPFPCIFEVTYTLSDANGMEVELSFENTGEEIIPAGMGWHPYFSISEKIEDSSLQLPDLQFVEIDDRMLPTGKRHLYNAFKTMKKIGDTSLDNGFFIHEKEGKYEVQLTSEKGNFHYWQETGERKFNFIQIFTPPYRTCIALEPMTCNVNAFNNKEGLVILGKGEKLVASCGFSFEKRNL